jgi:tetratricopeptide (TPR) repeat protein
MYLEAADLEAGIAEMQAVIQLHPDFPEAHQALGMAYTEQGRLDDAIAHLQHALALAPDLAVVRNHLGRMYMAQGRLQEAIQTFRALVERAPEVAEARHNLAVAYARQGLQEPAIEQFTAALGLRPDFHAARIDLATLLLENGRLLDAIATLEAAFASTPPTLGRGDASDLVEVRYRLGIAYAMAGRQQEAVQELEAVLQAQPTYAAAHASLGRLYYQLRQFAPAWQHARRAESLGLPVAELLAALRRVAAEPQ